MTALRVAVNCIPLVSDQTFPSPPQTSGPRDYCVGMVVTCYVKSCINTVLVELTSKVILTRQTSFNTYLMVKLPISNYGSNTIHFVKLTTIGEKKFVVFRYACEFAISSMSNNNELWQINYK